MTIEGKSSKSPNIKANGRIESGHFLTVSLTTDRKDDSDIRRHGTPTFPISEESDLLEWNWTITKPEAATVTFYVTVTQLKSTKIKDTEKETSLQMEVKIKSPTETLAKKASRGLESIKVQLAWIISSLGGLGITGTILIGIFRRRNNSLGPGEGEPSNGSDQS